jgi:hypothetical protein
MSVPKKVTAGWARRDIMCLALSCLFLIDEQRSFSPASISRTSRPPTPAKTNSGKLTCYKVSVKSKSLMTPSVFTTGTGVTLTKCEPLFMCARLRAEAPRTAPDWSGRKLWWRSREKTCAYKAGGTAARAYYRTGLLVDNTSPRPAHNRKKKPNYIYTLNLTYLT